MGSSKTNPVLACVGGAGTVAPGDDIAVTKATRPRVGCQALLMRRGMMFGLAGAA